MFIFLMFLDDIVHKRIICRRLTVVQILEGDNMLS